IHYPRLNALLTTRGYYTIRPSDTTALNTYPEPSDASRLASVSTTFGYAYPRLREYTIHDYSDTLLTAREYALSTASTLSTTASNTLYLTRGYTIRMPYPHCNLSTTFRYTVHGLRILYDRGYAITAGYTIGDPRIALSALAGYAITAFGYTIHIARYTIRDLRIRISADTHPRPSRTLSTFRYCPRLLYPRYEYTIRDLQCILTAADTLSGLQYCPRPSDTIHGPQIPHYYDGFGYYPHYADTLSATECVSRRLRIHNPRPQMHFNHDGFGYRFVFTITLSRMHVTTFRIRYPRPADTYPRPLDTLSVRECTNPRPSHALSTTFRYYPHD
ncbi:hypothetical protein AVEN_168458-1, partial [Araneus ventricosus]